MGTVDDWRDFETVRARVTADQEDVLGAAILVWDEPQLWDRLWARFVDLLVEGLFLEVRERYLAGLLDTDAYVRELRELAARCRAVGLEPLPVTEH